MQIVQPHRSFDHANDAGHQLVDQSMRVALRKWCLCWLVLAIGLTASAQQTTTTATIVDSTGVTWVFANYTITLVSPIPAFTNPGHAFFQKIFTGQANSSGAISIPLQSVANITPANTTWRFCITPSISATATYCTNVPVGNTGQNIQDVSAQITAVLVPPLITQGVGLLGYADSEFPAIPGTSYYNVASNTFRCYTTAWAACGGGGGGGGSSITIENIYASPGSFTFAHHLNSVFNQVHCITRTGVSTYGPATWTDYPVDASDTAVIVPAAGDYICSFNSSGTLAPPTGDFSVAVSPSSKTYEPTMSGTQSPTFAVTQTATGGYSGTATYTASGLASGMSGVYSPTSITGSGSSSLTVSFPSTQAPATTSFTVQGSDGTHTHTASPTLTVGNMNIGLADCWPMTDGTGVAFADSCNTSNTLTLVAGGFTWQANYTLPGSTALLTTGYFSGANQTATNFTGATAFSVSTWIGNSTWTGGSRAVMSTLDPSSSFAGWELEVDAAGAPHAFLINTYPSNAIETAGNTGMSTGLHYVVETYDGSKTAAGVKFYVDAVLQTNVTPIADTLTGSIANTKPVTVGGRTNGTDLLAGVEAFTRLYSRALTQTDVTNYFTAGPR